MVIYPARRFSSTLINIHPKSPQTYIRKPRCFDSLTVAVTLEKTKVSGKGWAVWVVTKGEIFLANCT